MKILTPENTCFEMNSLPDEIDDIRYCVMDVTDKEDPDFFFIPLVFIETFSAPSMNISIGSYNIEMPIDWNIMIGEAELGLLEFIPLTSIKHGVTKYRITLNCFSAKLKRDQTAKNPTLQWVSLDELDNYPLSTTGRKICKVLKP